MNNELLKNNPEMSPRPSIQNASSEDAENILTIQSQKIIVPEQKAERQEAEEGGFLIYPVSAEELAQILEDNENHIIKIAKESDKVVGYIISYDMTEWEKTHTDWFSKLDASGEDKTSLRNEKVLYGRHIAVDEHATSSGVGKELLDSTLQEAIGRGYRYFVVEILKEPITNSGSVGFVQKAGFRLVGQTEDQNNRIWSVFLKDLTE
ncbi:MAG: hypothetical protein G01um101444_486 [Parcubacteria group bacterium Gr01-1014_44]|nr:MAG: hypothetical protein G01um101444_486 [Parcubacteria group bacterium Gr01-1014_44]